MRNVLRGLNYNLKGWRFFLTHKSLWKFALIPLLLNILAFALILFLYFRFHDQIFTTLFSPFAGLDIPDPQGILQNALDGIYWIVRLVLKALIFVTSFILVIACAFVASLVINGPFYELLSEKVLILTGRRQDKPFSVSGFLKEFFHSLKTELSKGAFFLSITVVLFGLSWIPVVGIAIAAIQLVFSSWFFAFGICAYPMVLERLSVRTLFRWAARRKALLLGFGLPSLIPFFGLVFMNVQIVGGTLLYVEDSDAS